MTSELGRPDDGTSPTGFFNCEFYVGLRPSDEWPDGVESKPELIAAIQDKLAEFPGVIFNFTQPAEDAVDEASTGLKSSLAIKVFGSDLKQLEAPRREHPGQHRAGARHRQHHDRARAGPAQPRRARSIGRRSRATASTSRRSIDVIESAVGGVSATQVIQGERQFDLVVRDG